MTSLFTLSLATLYFNRLCQKKNNHTLHGVDSLNISVISGYLVYLYTLTVFHRKINLLLRKERYRSNEPRVTIDHPDQLGSSSFFTSLT